MLDMLTQPFVIFQLIITVVYFFEGLFHYGAILFLITISTASINYIILVKAFLKIKETAEKKYKVTVFRNSCFEDISNEDLVPGDIFVPPEEVPCDCLVIQGELFVNEVNLTGENVPIPKTAVSEEKNFYDKNHWLFEGSKVDTMREQTLALAINTGFGTKKGQILRKILHTKSRTPELLKRLAAFQL
jgi:cation-transporting P-type ATPase 13A2